MATHPPRALLLLEADRRHDRARLAAWVGMLVAWPLLRSLGRRLSR